MRWLVCKLSSTQRVYNRIPMEVICYRRNVESVANILGFLAKA